MIKYPIYAGERVKYTGEGPEYRDELIGETATIRDTEKAAIRTFIYVIFDDLNLAKKFELDGGYGAYPSNLERITRPGGNT